MFIIIVLFLLLLLGLSLFLGSRYQTAWAWIGIAIVILAAVVLFADSQRRSDQQRSEIVKPLKPLGPGSLISRPASWEQIQLAAKQRNYQHFFSLGEPSAEQQLRLDLNTKGGEFQLGYLGPESQQQFSASQPVFDTLVANARYRPKIANSIAQAAGKRINNSQFIVYLPAKDALRDDVFFAASRERGLLATVIVSGNGNKQQVLESLQISSASAE